MKKLLIILITIPLIFNSCKKEDDSPNSGSNNTSGSIIGTWKLIDNTNTYTTGYIDPVFLTEVETNTETNSGIDPDRDEYWRYTDDGIFSIFNYSNDTLNNYYHMEYEKNGNEIEITDYGDIILTQTITLLSSSNFNWGGEYEYTWEINDTSFFERSTYNNEYIKSQLPSITTEPLNKKKPVNGYNSFLKRRKK